MIFRALLACWSSVELLSVEKGSLYPARNRMEQNGWISSEWAIAETKRTEKCYRLAAVGKIELDDAEKSFEQLVKGVRAMLRYV